MINSVVKDLQSATFNAIEDPLLLIWASGKIAGANKAFLELFPASLSKVFNPQDLRRFREALQMAGLKKTVVVVDLRGHKRSYLMRATITASQANGEMCLVAHFKDDFKDLIWFFNSLAVPFYIKAPRGYYVVCNQFYADIIHLEIDEILGKKDAGLSFDATAKERISFYESIAKKTRKPHFTYFNQDEARQENETYWVFCSAYQNEAGIGVVSLFFDKLSQNAFSAAQTRALALLQTVIDGLDQEIYIKDEKRHLINCNKSFAKRAGAAKKDIVGKTLYDIKPAIAESIEGLEEQLLDNPNSEAAKSPLYDSEGEPAGMGFYKFFRFAIETGKQGVVGIVADITKENEQKEQLLDARRRLEEERLFLQQIIDSLPAPLYVKDAQGRLLKCNVAFAKTFGKQPSDLTSLYLSEIDLEPELAKQIETFDFHFAENPGSDSIEMEFIYPNGSPMRARGYYSPIWKQTDSKNSYNGLACIIFDTTEEWNLNKQLYESEERWHLALQAASDGIYDYKIDEDIFYYSARFLEILRLPADIPRQGFVFFLDLIHRKDLNYLEELQKLRYGKIASDAISIEHRVLCGDSVYRWMQQKVILMRKNGKPSRIIGVLSDITERKNYEEQIKFQASHDLLTGLPNRSSFHERLKEEMAVSKKKDFKLAVCLLDLDGFKQINDTMGHQSGDELLKIIARRLSASLRSFDFVCRMGGDEFVFILSKIKEKTEAVELMNKVLSLIQDPIILSEGDAQISGSIGIAFYPDDADEERDLVRAADEAMYQAKRKGRQQVAVVN